MTTETTDKRPIRGWLILIAIILWVTAVCCPITAVVGFARSTGILDQISTMITGVLAIITLVTFHRRRKSFIAWYIAFQAVCLINDFVLLFNPSTLVDAIVGIVVDVLLLSYVIKSKRVRETFVI